MPAFDSPPSPGASSPTVTIADNLAGTANSTSYSIAYSLVFSVAVTGLEVSDLTVTNGTVSTLTGSGTNWTVNVTPAMGVPSGTMGLTLNAGAVVDAAGILNASAANSSQAIDTLAPTVANFSPLDDAVGVALNSNIVVTFSEGIQSGNGNILLKTASGTTVATYVTGSSNLSIAGNALTINPTTDLGYTSGYTVEFAAGSINDLAGNPYAGIASYNFSTVDFVNSAPSGSVTITGTPTQGQTLVASSTLSDPDGLGAIGYQWSANGTAIPGATSSTLTLLQAQVGKTITVTASYTDGRGKAESKTSLATIAVANVNNHPVTGSVRIAGTEMQGETLAVTSSLADADGLGTVSYQWKAGGAAITGATAITFTLTEAQVGKLMTVAASYTDALGSAESLDSSATGVVVNLNDSPTGTVSFTGSPIVGQLLSAVNTLADPDGLGVIAYQWKANGTAISGATSSTLTLTDAQAGKIVTVTANYIDGHGTAESVSSPPLSFVTSVPSIDRVGTSANDTLSGGAGNDRIDGLAGLDTVNFTRNLAAYAIASLGVAGNNSVSGPDGTDALTSIERLHFADIDVAFDIEGNAGQVYRLYQAAFNRVPDLPGLGGWVANMDRGLSLLDIANHFMASPEFLALYGANPTNEQFVKLLYANALHRGPDAAGVSYWVNQLTTNLQSRTQVLANFSESGENKAGVQLAVKDGIYFITPEQAAGVAKGQNFLGTATGDTFIGTSGNDTFNGGAGNDNVIGGRGTDTSVYVGTKASHTITRTSLGLTVSGSLDGTDTLSSVERLKFDDAVIATDIDGIAGQAYRLYQAAFNRTPDTKGLSDWIRGMDNGLSLQEVALGFIKSAEFTDLMGTNPTDLQFVDQLYTNVLHRAPDADGEFYWLSQLNGGFTRQSVLVGFSESAENKAALIGVIQNGIELAV